MIGIMGGSGKNAVIKIFEQLALKIHLHLSIKII